MKTLHVDEAVALARRLGPKEMAEFFLNGLATIVYGEDVPHFVARDVAERRFPSLPFQMARASDFLRACTENRGRPHKPRIECD